MLFVVQGVEPLLDFKRLDVLCDLVAPFCDKDVPNIVLKDRLGILRLRTGGYLWVEFDLEIVFCQFVKSDPT